MRDLVDTGPGRLALALGAALAAAAAPGAAQTRTPPQPPPEEVVGYSVQEGQEMARERQEVARLMQELESLKAAYTQEVRRLRELDMQMQALQARLSGRVATAPAAPPPQAAPAAPAQAPPPATAQAPSPAPTRGTPGGPPARSSRDA